MDRIRGGEFRESLFGEQAVAEHKLGSTEMLAPELTRLTDEANFGGIWQLPGLSVRDRQLVTVTALAVLGHERELAAHLRAAVRAGFDRAELVQAMVQLTFYAGIPAVHTALRVVQAVFADIDAPCDNNDDTHNVTYSGKPPDPRNEEMRQ